VTGVLTRRTLLQALAAPAAIPARAPERFVGITVMPEDYQVEGIEQVLRNVKTRAGVTAVATSPYVMAPSDREYGQRSRLSTRASAASACSTGRCGKRSERDRWCSGGTASPIGNLSTCAKNALHF